MGALHQGHLSLIRAAASASDTVVTSIFVNPLQFGPTEDLARYPRQLPLDCELAESAGCDVVYAPDVQEIYPNRSTVVTVPEVGDRWEGAHRPGHFDGVSTVVCKLFHIVGPCTAFFGQKDLQQCLVIRRMVRDLWLPVGLSFEPTIREASGLAMSSRNAYLSESDRIVAPELFKSLNNVAKSAPQSSLIDALKTDQTRLSVLGFSVDYLACVDLEAMSPLSELTKSCAIIVAARLGTTRLIDNLLLGADRLSA